MVSREVILKTKREEGIENLKIVLHMLKRTYGILAKDAGVSPAKINSVFNLSRNYEESEWVLIFKKLYNYIETDKDIKDLEFITKKINDARQQILFFDSPENICIESLNYINPTLSGDIPSNKVVELLGNKERLIYFIGELGSGNSFTINQSILKLKQNETPQFHICIDFRSLSEGINDARTFITHFIKEVIKTVKLENPSIKLKPSDYDVETTMIMHTPLRILMNNIAQATNKNIYLWLTGVDYLYKYYKNADLVHSFLMGLVAGTKNETNRVNIIFSFNVLLEENNTNKHIISSLITTHAVPAGEQSLWNSEDIKKVIRFTGLPIKGPSPDELIEKFNEIGNNDQYRTISKNIINCFNGVASITSLIIYLFYTNKIDEETLLDLNKCKNLKKLKEINNKIENYNRKCRELEQYYSTYLKSLGNTNQGYKIEKLRSNQIL